MNEDAGVIINNGKAKGDISTTTSSTTSTLQHSLKTNSNVETKNGILFDHYSFPFRRAFDHHKIVTQIRNNNNNWKECTSTTGNGYDDVLSMKNHRSYHHLSTSTFSSSNTKIDNETMTSVVSFGSISTTKKEVKGEDNLEHKSLNYYLSHDDVVEKRNVVTTRLNEEQWYGVFEELCQYKETFGDCLVPVEYMDNPRLGNWVDNQRVQYRKRQLGDRSTMTSNRINMLEDIGFVWYKHEDQWNEKYEELKAYKEKHGTCHVPMLPKPHPLHALSLWVMTQRGEYMRRNRDGISHITDERVEALNQLGFVWNFKNENWWHKFDELKAYQEEHGDCLVPQKYKPNQELATWVDVQRQQYRLLKMDKPSSMTEDRIQNLNDIGFIWNANDYQW
eukprot:CAMPEP_0184873634 /NCGR_PEP_ID=MMETSP0580-20130426/41954_1 /TAXON_ID=1118495 /ORGANISM="Dactyliosolen fragilissimus" /LENGTH=390 /DNA_ID=CAMNT_0027376563 /DNA_START=422 /DNA_END=1591 /DNA_ORIENTATION=-